MMRAKAIGGCADGTIIGPDSGGYRHWRVLQTPASPTVLETETPGATMLTAYTYRLELLSYARKDGAVSQTWFWVLDGLSTDDAFEMLISSYVIKLSLFQ